MLYQCVNNVMHFVVCYICGQVDSGLKKRSVMPPTKKTYELYILVAKSVNRTNCELFMFVVQCVL
jgi:hypothetical protein